jgi:hypothetical protein
MTLFFVNSDASPLLVSAGKRDFPFPFGSSTSFPALREFLVTLGAIVSNFYRLPNPANWTWSPVRFNMFFCFFVLSEGTAA